jgi:hypothetical protein
MTAADAPRRPNLAFRPIRDVVLPLGTVRLGTPDFAAGNDNTGAGVVWRATLRVGVLPRPRRASADDRPPRQGPARLGETIDAGTLLAPLVCFEPCVHRHARRAVVLRHYTHYLDHGDVDATLTDLWLLGAEAQTALVPEPRTSADWCTAASGRLAVTLDERRAGEDGPVVSRRLLRRAPFALLSPSMRVTPRVGLLRDAPSSLANALGIDRVLDEATPRGPPDLLQVPEPDVDLLHRFPARPRGRSTPRNPRSFVARLAHPELARGDQQGWSDAEKELVEALGSWRDKHLRTKGRPWVLPDLDVACSLHGPAPTLDEGVVLGLAVTWARSCPTLTALHGLVAALPWMGWRPSPWFVGGDDAVLHRLVVRSADDRDAEAVARLYVGGAPWVHEGDEAGVIGFVLGGEPTEAPDRLPLIGAEALRVEIETFAR